MVPLEKWESNSKNKEPSIFGIMNNMRVIDCFNIKKDMWCLSKTEVQYFFLVDHFGNFMFQWILCCQIRTFLPNFVKKCEDQIHPLKYASRLSHHTKLVVVKIKREILYFLVFCLSKIKNMTFLLNGLTRIRQYFSSVLYGITTNIVV